MGCLSVCALALMIGQAVAGGNMHSQKAKNMMNDDNNGGVVISIEKTLHYDVSTRIFYWDKENDAKNKAEVESDL